MNSAGSTGISLHASERFQDQRRRKMIVAQADLNIDTFMQTLGRVFRTGQVEAPTYQLLFTDLPAEKRPAAVLAKKMASLNANTTASKDSDTTFKNIPDFLNKYGDRIAMQVVNDFPELSDKMGNPLTGMATSEGAMQRLTGYISLLNVDEQTRFYDALEENYNELVEQLQATDDFDLETKIVPLDAKLIRKETLVPAKNVGKETPFANAAEICEYDVKQLGKPYTPEQVEDLIKNGKKVNVQAVRKEFDQWAEKKQTDLTDAQKENWQIFENYATYLWPGQTVDVTIHKDDTLKGIVTSVYKKGKSDNPIALSTWKVDIAINDAAKKITTSFSQIANGLKSEDFIIKMSQARIETIYDMLKSGQANRRERAIIATGNILAANERLEGQKKVILFSDQDGKTVAGIRLPKNTTIADILGNTNIALNPEQVLKFLDTTLLSNVKTEDGKFHIRQEYEDNYEIKVPAAKANGGVFYLNNNIIQAAGKDFVKRGNMMYLSGITRKQAEEILNILSKQGYGFIADNHREEARAIANQQSLASLGVQEEIAPGEFLPPDHNVATQGMERAKVEETVERLHKQAVNAAPTVVVQSFRDLPFHLRDRFARDKETLEGVYDPATGTVYLVADNLSGATRAAEVWAHEQVGHNGLDGIVPDQMEQGRMLGRLWLQIGGMGNPLVKEISDLYGLDPRNSMEERTTVMKEVIARLAEKKGKERLNQTEQNLWQKFVAAVKRLWDGFIQKITGSKNAEMNKDGLDGLLSALGEYVFEGKPANIGDIIENDTSSASINNGRETNSYGVPNERVTVFEKELSREELDEALQELAGKDLHNEIENIDAQVNSTQRRKMKSGAAVSKSEDNGFSQGEHLGIASKIENLWKWAAREGLYDEDSGVKDVLIGRYVAPISINGKDHFAWITVKHSSDGNRIYSVELMKEDKLKGTLDTRFSNKKSHTPALSFKEIISKLKSPVKENSTPLASFSLRRILGMKSKEAMQAAKNNEDVKRILPEKDMNTLTSVFTLPHWVAKKWPSFAKLYSRQLERIDTRAKDLKNMLEAVPSLFGKNRLGDKDLESLRDLLWSMEGKLRIPDALQKAEKGKFIIDGRLENGREKIAVNPSYYDVFDKVIDGTKATDKAKAAMKEIRRSLDNAFVLAHNKLAGMSAVTDDAIKQLRQQLNATPNYFPHHRYGKYYVMAKEKDSNYVAYRRHFDAFTKGEAQAIANEWRDKLQGKEKYKDMVWSWGENKKLPEDVLGSPIDTEAMTQIIKQAVKQVSDKEQAAEIENALLESTANILKARGWNAHAIGRKDISGYETEDITRVLYDYLSGLTGWLTKIDAAHDMSQYLGFINARKQPRLYSYSMQYMRDMLRNSDNIDRITGNIRALFFYQYLGGNIKTAVVNATQNIIVGLPRLQMDLQGARWTGVKYLKAAYDSIAGAVTKNKNLSEDEARLIDELYQEKTITDAFMQEVRGHIDKESLPGSKILNGVAKVLGAPMGIVERFNRCSLALAAYRMARDGHLTPDALARLGVKEGQKPNHEQAKAFAKEIVLDSHFVYGKSNMPQIVRSSAAGRILSPTYTFRSFTANTLSLWEWALSTQGKAGMSLVAKSLLATVALGGLTAFPFYATLAALYAAITGEDEDWTTKIRRNMQGMNLERDLLCYGLPALAGVNLGGSLAMETPIARPLNSGKHKTLKDIFAETLWTASGIPGSVVEQASRAIEAGRYGNRERVIEELSPMFVKNIMSAKRLYEEGQTSLKGKPINEPGVKDARKLNLSEAVKKALGFQPLSSTKSYSQYQAEQMNESVRTDKLNELVLLELKAREEGDKSARPKMRKLKDEWNQRMDERGKSSYKITTKDIVRTAKRRREGNKPTKKNIRKRNEERSVWE